MRRWKSPEDDTKREKIHRDFSMEWVRPSDPKLP